MMMLATRIHTGVESGPTALYLTGLLGTGAPIRLIVRFWPEPDEQLCLL